MSESDRRRAPREEAYVAAELRREDHEPRLAVVQDASTVGLQVLTNSRLEAGDRLEITVHVDGETRVEVAGVVRRLEAVETDGAWRFRIGIELDAPSEALAAHARTIRERQRHFQG